jgi:hypothetical protein
MIDNHMLVKIFVVTVVWGTIMQKLYKWTVVWGT